MEDLDIINQGYKEALIELFKEFCLNKRLNRPRPEQEFIAGYEALQQCYFTAMGHLQKPSP